jgi:hypothetical protein
MVVTNPGSSTIRHSLRRGADGNPGGLADALGRVRMNIATTYVGFMQMAIR